MVREYEGKREGVAMRWGLIPSWAKDKKMAQINARADTAAEKPMFRQQFPECQLAIPQLGPFYKWPDDKARRGSDFLRGPGHGGAKLAILRPGSASVTYRERTRA